MGYEIKVTVKSLRALHSKFLRMGCTPEEASNLCANMFGIPAVPGGWKLKEIQKILFEEYRNNSTAHSSMD